MASLSLFFFAATTFTYGDSSPSRMSPFFQFKRRTNELLPVPLVVINSLNAALSKSEYNATNLFKKEKRLSVREQKDVCTHHLHVPLSAKAYASQELAPFK